MITNSNCPIPISLQNNDVDFRPFKQWMVFGHINKVLDIKGLRHQVAKI